jgi:hypothetical protein
MFRPSKKGAMTKVGHAIAATRRKIELHVNYRVKLTKGET